MNPLIELRDIRKTYIMGKTSVKALDGVSLAIQAGEFVAIMGASGSGKSTLLSIVGLLDRPTSGSYRLMGEPVEKYSDDELSVIRNRAAGFVFQQFYLLPKMTALENAELPLVYAGRRNMRAHVQAVLDDVGIGPRADHYPNEMSGGEQQRVAISRAVVNDPMIIMADEPTGNLDTTSEEEIIRILEEMNDQGRTIVMVTHEDELARHARRIIRMRDGKVISDTTQKGHGKEAKRAARDDAGGLSGLTGVSMDRAELLDYVTQSFRTIVSHKMRSFLSILGILIGVAAVISMMAIGQGAKDAISQKLSSLGSGTLMVTPGARQQHGVMTQTGSVARFTFQDVELLSRLKEIKGVSAMVSGRAQLVYMNRNWNTLLQGVSVEYQNIKSASPIAGRFFDRDDLADRRKVALVGTTVLRELFGNDDPVGKTIKINKQNFVVIGVLPVKGASPMRDQDDVVIVPVTTAMYRLLGKKYIDMFDIEVADITKVQETIDAITELLNRRHRVGSGDEAFSIRDMSEMRDAVMSTTRTISMLLGIVASISLFVGGIGIMNIMLVSVRERIKEIGLRKAIGAKRRDILIQFLIEAVLMSLLGGIGGILFGSVISLSLAAVTKWTVSISLSSIAISTIFSSLVGLFFGLWPAIQASRLDPIVALRYE
jgi:macrolide transport system ATP-binding/permease protein